MKSTEDLVISLMNDINANLGRIIDIMPHRVITPLNYNQISELHKTTHSLQQQFEQQLKQLNSNSWTSHCASLNEQYKSTLASIHSKIIKYLMDELESSEIQAKMQPKSRPY
jgi:hypothetical protein